MSKNKLSSLSDLKPASYNPREIGIAELKALSNSLGHFGDLSGITWNSNTGNIVCGHQRLSALKAKYGPKLKLNISPDGGGCLESPDGEFRIRVVDWPIEKEKAANIAANSPTVAGKFTDDLQAMLADIMEYTPEYFEDLRLKELEAAALEGEAEEGDEGGSGSPEERPDDSTGGDMQVIFYAANQEEWEWMRDTLKFDTAGQRHSKDVGLALPASWLIERWPSK